MVDNPTHFAHTRGRQVSVAAVQLEETAALQTQNGDGSNIK